MVETGNVLRCFGPETSLLIELSITLAHAEERIFTAGRTGTGHFALAGIVGGYGRGPVTELFIKLLQIISSGFRGFEDIKTLVPELILVEAVLHSRERHKLPCARGAGTGLGLGVVPAFHAGKIGEFLGYSLLPESLLHVGKVLFSAFRENGNVPAALIEEILVLVFHSRPCGRRHAVHDLPAFIVEHGLLLSAERHTAFIGN